MNNLESSTTKESILEDVIRCIELMRKPIDMSAYIEYKELMYNEINKVIEDKHGT